VPLTLASFGDAAEPNASAGRRVQGTEVLTAEVQVMPGPLIRCGGARVQA